MSDYYEPKKEDLEIEQVEDLSQDSKYQKLLERLEKFKLIIQQSKLFKETVEKLDSNFDSIRCLALGSPLESSNALYQLVYLILLIQEKNIGKISIYDPIFNKYDIFLMKNLNYQIEMEYTPEHQEKTIYFMPHAPLELTNVIIKNDKPLFLLGNNLINHTDRFTKLKLHQTYPLIALLVQLVDSNSDDNQGFVKPKKRKNKLVYQEPVINYDYTINDCYFNHLTIDNFTNNFSKNDPWGNSFSDLSYHKISLK